MMCAGTLKWKTTLAKDNHDWWSGNPWKSGLIFHLYRIHSMLNWIVQLNPLRIERSLHVCCPIFILLLTFNRGALLCGTLRLLLALYTYMCNVKQHMATSQHRTLAPSQGHHQIIFHCERQYITSINVPRCNWAFW